MSLDRMTTFSWIYDLYRLGQSAAALENTQEVYQQILIHTVTGFDAESGSLALRDEAGDKLAIVAGMDLPAGIIGSSVAMGAGVLGWVAREGRALLLNGSIANDPRFPQRPKRDESATPNSAICWPLKTEDRVIGAISVNRSAGRPSFTEADLEQGTAMLNLVSLALGNIRLHIDQQQRIAELKELNNKLEETHNQLLQSEKMASIGQLAAGVAHEINNPIGYVYSNLGALEKYIRDVFSVLDAYEGSEGAGRNEAALAELGELKKKVDLSFLKEDMPALMSESKEGISRVKQIVQNLKDFSHVGAEDEWQWADLHKGLD
ncbi:MAG: GAF domain-containing protein, partial [Pseudomonadota bacterium]